MIKKSSFERVHESSVALMREKAHTSGTTTQRAARARARARDRKIGAYSDPAEM